MTLRISDIDVGQRRLLMAQLAFDLAMFRVPNKIEDILNNLKGPRQEPIDNQWKKLGVFKLTERFEPLKGTDLEPRMFAFNYEEAVKNVQPWMYGIYLRYHRLSAQANEIPSREEFSKLSQTAKRAIILLIASEILRAHGHFSVQEVEKYVLPPEMNDPDTWSKFSVVRFEDLRLLPQMSDNLVDLFPDLTALPQLAQHWAEQTHQHEPLQKDFRAKTCKDSFHEGQG